MVSIIDRIEELDLMYSIIEVLPNSILNDEQLGTKDKFWFEHNSQRWLFKESRVIQTPSLEFQGFTGEDWAEKVAAEIAYILKIPAADVELANYNGRRGSASLNFIPADGYQLEHGNEILAGRVLGYDDTKKQRQSDHTLQNIIIAIQAVFQDRHASQAALEQLASYLVLDALIGNADRHHENWGVFWRASIRTNDGSQPIEYEVAPTFDHASSLGRELLDHKKGEILRGCRIERYVRKCRGGIYENSSDKKGLSPIELVEKAALRYPTYFQGILNRLRHTRLSELSATLNDVPDALISPVSREFATIMLGFTYGTLVGIQS